MRTLKNCAYSVRIGSALNDTIQQAGAALGIAVLGSILSSSFTAAMPDSAPAVARQSIGDALAVAAQTGDSALVAMARDAFATAMSASFIAGAAGVVAAAVLALFVMRNNKTAPVAETANLVEESAREMATVE
ncbi:hypothetical protein ACQP1G_45760 [Nocardia sp. CA-107356]|uniref:hypothetical protein n=1 Tax=Nocardia sp. CA-107356 TaxID=3239972 RepID=UPI003D90C7E9